MTSLVQLHPLATVHITVNRLCSKVAYDSSTKDDPYLQARLLLLGAHLTGYSAFAFYDLTEPDCPIVSAYYYTTQNKHKH
jgi:hypothetical protein